MGQPKPVAVVAKPSDKGSSTKDLDPVEACAGESSGLGEQLELKEESGYEEPKGTESPVEEGGEREDVEEGREREDVKEGGRCEDVEEGRGRGDVEEGQERRDVEEGGGHEDMEEGQGSEYMEEGRGREDVVVEGWYCCCCCIVLISPVQPFIPLNHSMKLPYRWKYCILCIIYPRNNVWFLAIVKVNFA